MVASSNLDAGPAIFIFGSCLVGLSWSVFNLLMVTRVKLDGEPY